MLTNDVYRRNAPSTLQRHQQMHREGTSEASIVVEQDLLEGPAGTMPETPERIPAFGILRGRGGHKGDFHMS